MQTHVPFITTGTRLGCARLTSRSNSKPSLLRIERQDFPVQSHLGLGSLSTVGIAQRHISEAYPESRDDSLGNQAFEGGLEQEFSSFREGIRLPTQGESLVKGIDPRQGIQLAEKPPDVDFLQELIAMQSNGPKNIGFFGTRNMGFMHQNLIEVLSYAMVLTGNHIFTSGATGTNAAVIRGAVRAENPELLTVVLPQSLDRQPPESQELLADVKTENLIEMPQNNGLSLGEASRICNRDIVNRVQQVICFAFHDSSLLLETCREASENRKMVTLFYLD